MLHALLVGLLVQLRDLVAGGDQLTVGDNELVQIVAVVYFLPPLRSSMWALDMKTRTLPLVAA